MKKQPSLYTIYLQYTSKHLQEGLEHLELLENKLSSNGAHKRIIVDNALPCGSIKKNSSVAIHGGNNAYREFSGWEQGIILLKKQGLLNKNDVILFANDTFFRNYDPKWLESFKPSHFHRAAKRKIIVGWRGSFHQKFSFLNHTGSHWIRTNCFLINYGLLASIQPLHIKELAGDFFSGQAGSFFSCNAPLSKDYKAYIRAWLFKDFRAGIKLSKSWYLSKSITENNIRFFEQKALAIICEHALSARVVNNRGKLVFINKKSFRKSVGRLKRRCLSAIHGLLR